MLDMAAWEGLHMPFSSNLGSIPDLVRDILRSKVVGDFH